VEEEEEGFDSDKD
jgi:TfoX/Sxy family transcriptional regulator of competence genes